MYKDPRGPTLHPPVPVQVILHLLCAVLCGIVACIPRREVPPPSNSSCRYSIYLNSPENISCRKYLLRLQDVHINLYTIHISGPLSLCIQYTSVAFTLYAYNTHKWPSLFMHKIHITGHLSLGNTIHKTGPLSLCIKYTSLAISLHAYSTHQ